MSRETQERLIFQNCSFAFRVFVSMRGSWVFLGWWKEFPVPSLVGIRWVGVVSCSKHQESLHQALLLPLPLLPGDSPILSNCIHSCRLATFFQS